MFSTGDYFAQLFAWTLLHFTWQGAFIFVSATACDSVLRNSPSSLRYRVTALHLVALGVVPLITLLVSHNAVASGVPLGASSGSPGVIGSLYSSLPPLLLPPFHLLARIFPYILLFWIAGILIGACLLIGGRMRLSRLHCVPCNRGQLSELVDDLARELGMKTRPLVFRANVGSPFVAGVRQQRLIVPQDIEQNLAPDELRAILAHELAHVKRSDYSSNLAQTLLALLLWPHPAAWMIWTQLRQEREACCDDAAVQICGSALPLARALYQMAGKLQRFDVAVAAAAGPLERRLRRLLHRSQPVVPAVSWAAPVLAMVALALATFLLARTLPTDTATRKALIVSPLGPTIFVQAKDPAGSFRVQLHRGRVLDVSIENEPIPRERVIQHGDSVRVLARSGQELLAMQVDPRGGISWQPRAERAPSTF